jgi:hypothetical protein
MIYFIPAFEWQNYEKKMAALEKNYFAPAFDWQ